MINNERIGKRIGKRRSTAWIGEDSIRRDRTRLSRDQLRLENRARWCEFGVVRA